MRASYRFAIVAIVLAACAAGWSALGSSAQEKKGQGGFVVPPLPKWEYKVEALSPDNAAAEKELNKLSEDGWELVGTSGNTRGINGTISTTERLIFKRLKQ